MRRDELESLFRGYGYEPHVVEGDEPEAVHQQMAATLDRAFAAIERIQEEPAATDLSSVRSWPMIILRTPKGWTGPKVVDGKKIEGTFRAHQVPMGDMEKPAHIKILEDWMKSYKPQELFDETGRLRPELAELAPQGPRRMSANPHANGGLLLRDLKMPDFRDYAIKVPKPGAVVAEATTRPGAVHPRCRQTEPGQFSCLQPR